VFQGVGRSLVEDSDSILLKVKNILGVNGLDFENVEFISNPPESKLLKADDILSPFIGQAVKLLKFSIFPHIEGRYFADNNCGIIRPNPNEVLPLYLLYVLRSRFCGEQIYQLIGGGGVPFLGAANAKKLLIPKPPIEKQKELVAEMEQARQDRRAKLAEAETLLSSLDDWLLAQLGITPPPEDNRKVFAVRFNTLKKTSLLNSEYFHPERIASIRNIEQQKSRIDVEPLLEIVNFIRIPQKMPTGKYLGLASVQSQTGEYLEINEEVSGNVLEFKKDDVLFGRLRPYLNKVYRAEFDGVCSPEFHVMRIINEKSLNPDYLATVLRSSIILAQTKHMMTGNTHPRLTNEDVINLVIPIPKIEVQNIVAEEVKKRRQQARQLQTEAESLWQAAKDRFEAQLLAGE